MTNTIDWNAPLETNEDNPRPLVIDGEDGDDRWVRLAETEDPNNEGAWFNDRGEAIMDCRYFEPHGIRNRKPAPQYPPELVEALRRAEMKLTAYVGVCKGDKELTEAVLPMVRKALADLPQPVDADLALAREIASTVVRNDFADLAFRGGMDNDGSVMAALAAIKRVRAEKG